MIDFARLLRRLRRFLPAAAGDNNVQLDSSRLNRIITGIATTSEDEIDCDECFRQLDRFAELYLAGKDAAQAIPLVQQHLDRCPDCREEFEALLRALEQEN